MFAALNTCCLLHCVPSRLGLSDVLLSSFGGSRFGQYGGQQAWFCSIDTSIAAVCAVVLWSFLRSITSAIAGSQVARHSAIACYLAKGSQYGQ